MKGVIINGFRTMPTRHRWSLVAVATAVVVAAGVGVFAGVEERSGSSSKFTVEFVLGGGTARTGKGPQLKVAGTFQGLAAGSSRDGTDVALFVSDEEGYRLWTVAPSGRAESVRVPGLSRVTHTAQATASPDGAYYVAADADGLWRVTRDGKATQIIKASAKADDADTSTAKQFSAPSIDGVAVATDGSVYFSAPQGDRDASMLVYRLNSGQVSRVAGLRLGPGESAPRRGPNFIDSQTGAAANSTFIPHRSNTGPLTWNKNSLYIHTGTGILRVTAAGRAFPVVAARDFGALKDPKEPFESFGKAINGYVSAPADDDGQHGSSITADVTSGDLYYGAGDPLPTGSNSGGRHQISPAFDWSGALTQSEHDFLSSTREDQVVYQVTATGALAAVTVRSKALAASNGYLYVATDSCPSSTGSCDASQRQAAVLRVRLPKK